jgi:hypothetical protein
MIGWLFWTAIALGIGWAWMKVATLHGEPIGDPNGELKELRKRLSSAITLTLLILGVFVLAKLSRAVGMVSDTLPGFW